MDLMLCEAVLPGYDEPQRRAILVGQFFAVQADRDQRSARASPRSCRSPVVVGPPQERGKIAHAGRPISSGPNDGDESTKFGRRSVEALSGDRERNPTKAPRSTAFDTVGGE